MARRRVQMVCTSSDEDEDDPQQRQPQIHNNPHHQQLPEEEEEEDDDDVFFQEAVVEQQQQQQVTKEIEIPAQNPIPNIESVTLNSSLPTTTTAAVEISDEEFIDVSDNLSPPGEVSTSSVASDCPVNDYLRKMGLNVGREWFDFCKLGLQETHSGFSTLDVETKAKLCFAQFLFSDMNYSGAGILPQNVHEMHLVDLAGPFVLQVDEVTNISCPLRERYKNAASGLKRCLKLSMTDGVQRVFGMEYRPIKSLEALACAGFKVVIRNVNVRRGLLMLVPEVLEVLGGSAEELEAARRRVVHEVNKPPRGKRTRSGSPLLSTRATLAAWPQNGVSNDTMPLNDANSVPGNATSYAFHATTQLHENVQGSDTVSRTRREHHTGRETTEVATMGGTAEQSISRESAQHNIGRETAEHYNIVEAHEPCTHREAAEPLHGREFAERSFGQETGQHSSKVEANELPTSGEAIKPPSDRESTELNSSSAIVYENGDADMVNFVEHPFILSGEKELPFAYLASLSAKWAVLQEKESFVRGKIKCFLTGVKGFQYKQRSTFELRVYVDDGSLISEILIHDNVVQKGIGCSPEEVTAALSSSDNQVVSDMKNTLKQFQLFLINFEGTMLVEMNESSAVPVALEMNQGSPASDGWLLLQRMKPVASSPINQGGQSDVINLSP